MQRYGSSKWHFESLNPIPEVPLRAKGLKKPFQMIWNGFFNEIEI